METTNDNMVDHLPCPRCGYDLRGLTSTWVDSCPLEIRCSECGLDFATAPAVNHELSVVPWLVECGPLRFGWLMTLVKTCVQVVVPWSFWRQVQMVLKIRIPRIVLAIVLLGVLIFGSITGGFAAAVLQSYQESSAGARAAHESDLRMLRMQLAIMESDRETFNAVADEDPRLLSQMGLDREGFEDYLERSKELLGDELDARTESLRGTVEAMTEMSLAHLDASDDALLFALQNPFSTNDLLMPGRFFSRRVIFDSPYEIWLDALNMDEYSEQYYFVGWLVLFISMGMPIFILCLPLTRRLAMVRWSHVLRAGGYGFIGAELALLLCAAVFAFPQLTGGSFLRGAVPQTIAVAFWGWLAWYHVFWFYAIRRYMKLPNVILMLILGTILLALLSLFGAALISAVFRFFGIG